MRSCDRQPGSHSRGRDPGLGIEGGFWQAAVPIGGLGAAFTRDAISPIEVVGCATSPQELVQSDSTNRAFAARRGAVRWLAGSGEAQN